MFFPTTADEWYVLASVMGPTLIEVALDFATDLIPIVGEAKSFARAFMAANNGNYTGAAGEFLGGIAGVIPIGDLIGQAPKLYQAAVKVFKSFRVVKALTKFSSSVFSKLKGFVEQGWKAIWNSNSEKLILKNSGDEVMAEFIDMHPNLPTTKIKSPAARSLIDIAKLKNLDDVPINASGSTSLASQVSENPLNHIKYLPDEPGMASDINSILINGDPKGKKTEELARQYFETGNGNFTWKDGKYNNSNNGFDNVFVNESTGDVIIDECKQWPPVLSGPNPSSGLPSQMSDGWVRDHVLVKLRQTGDPEKLALANQVEYALDHGLLTKTVSAIKNCTSCLDKGNIITIKVH